MQNTTLSLAQVEEQALTDPLAYAMASRDADVAALVRDALAAGRAQLAVQPVGTADNQNTTAFYEGLMRLTDIDGRVIPAAHFMPFVEESDLGRQIDCRSLELALQQLQLNPELRL